MLRAQRVGPFLAASALVLLSGCNTPEAVSKFCTESNTTLTSTVPVFQDLRGSCLREVNLQKGIGVFVALSSDPQCDEIGKQADGAAAAAQILADYFDAINALASFGTAKTSSDAATLVSKTGAAVGAGSLAQQALGSMAMFLTSAATNRYQQKSLNKDLLAASNNIGVVTDALVKIVQENYIGQELKSEDQKLGTRYREFALTHREGDVLLTLDERWHADQKTLATRRAAAQKVILALHCIKKGSADIAESGHSLKAKDLPGLLDPYITQLQTLIPQIQAAF